MKRPFLSRSGPFSAGVSCALLGLITCLRPVLHAQVSLNELSAASSDRLLQWSSAGVPRVGAGPAWWEPAFSDASWQTGPGPFGYGSVGTVGTNLQAALQNRTPTVYLRKTFTVSPADAAATSGLQLLVNYDSGFTAWINGREVARRNLGATNAFVAFDQHAHNQRIAGTTETIALPAPNGLLVPGDNLLAIVAANNNNTPSTINLNWVTDPINADPAFLLKADLRLNSAPVVNLVTNDSAWKFFPGYIEPSGTFYDPGLITQPLPAGGEDGDAEGPSAEVDWIELKNDTAVPVSLAGWALTDAANPLRQWPFPAGASIPASGFLTVICDSLDLPAGTGGALYHHTNFSLSPEGEYLALTRPDGTIASQIAPGYPKQLPFHTYGKNPSGTWVYLDTPTPGAANAGLEFTGIAAAPTPSVSGGFHPTAQSITLTTTTPGASIRYTSNGAEPTGTTGTPYTTPISIGSNTTLRFRAFAPGLLPSPVVTHTWLINQSAVRRSVPAVCLTADQTRTLYQPHGMMAVVGGSFGAVTASVWGNGGNNLAYDNCIPRGRFTERPATLEILTDSPTTPGLRTGIGLRLSGSTFQRPRYQLTNQNSASPNSDSPWTWNSNVQKPSFNLYFRSEYGESSFNHPFFPASSIGSYDSFRLRSGKNDNTNPWMRDEAIRRIYLNMGHPSATGRISTLYVNGVFKGFYNPTERLRVEFFQKSLGTSNPIDIRQMSGGSNGLPAEIDGGDTVHYDEMIAFAKAANFATLAAWDGIRQRLDVENFIDYLLLNIHGAPGDWGTNNLVTYRERAPWGRQKFALWDGESAYTATRQKINVFDEKLTNATQYSQGSPAAILYTELKDSPEFRLLFADRIQRHFFNNGALTDAAMLAKWDPLAAEFLPLLREVSGNSSSSVTPLLRTWLEGQGTTSRYSDSPTVNRPTRRNTLFTGFNDDTAGGAFVPGHFRSANVWPLTSPPVFSRPGGGVPDNFSLAITHSNAAGTLLYTLDGSDPRLPGGARSPAALTYTQPIILTRPTLVRARVNHPAATDANPWSALTEAVFNPATSRTLLVISEIHYHPVTNALAVPPEQEEDFEFIEIHNPGPDPAILGGFRFTQGIDFTFPGGFTLAPGARTILAHNPAAFAIRYPGITPAGSFPSSSLSNTGETLTLTDVAGNITASVTWQDTFPWPAQADGNGWSLVLTNPAGPQGDPANWRPSVLQGGSPGTADLPAATPPVYVNEVLANSGPLAPDFIELFNPNPDPIDIGSWFLSDDPTVPAKFRIPAGTSIPAGGFLVFTADQFNAAPAAPGSFSLSSEGDDVWLFSADPTGALTGYSHGFSFTASEEGVSLARFVTSTASERLVRARSPTPAQVNFPPQIGPIVITEFMYHPLPGGVEYIEIRNTAPTPVPLFDPAFPDNPWSIGGIAYRFPPDASLLPGQYGVLCAEDPAAFRLRYNIAPAVPVFGPFSGSLSNGGESLSLRKPGFPVTDPATNATIVPEITIDRVLYDDALPWPPAADGTGMALERLGDHRFADDPLVWRATPPNPGRPASLTFIEWQAAALYSLPPALTAPTADPEGDGLVNLIEYATGSDPLQASPHPLSIAPDASTLRIHRSPTATGITLRLMESTTLGQWTPIPLTTPFTDQGDGTESLPLPLSTTPIGRAFRLQAE